MKYRLAYIVIWLLFVQNRASFQLTGETLDQYFACYGITHESVMKPSCSRTGDLIAPREVYVGAKQNSSGCPTISTDSSTTQTCCTYNADDCTGTYRNINTPSNTHSYHSDCIGLHDCSTRGRAAATMDSLYLSCPSGNFYLSQSNYMYMEYYCISETRIGTLPSAAIEATDSIVYLKGQTYPNPINETTSGCSVEAVNCTSNIDVYFIDIRLANDTNGCTQHFDLSGTSFDCSNNNDFTIQIPYRSSSNYLNVNFTATVFNTGYFWLGFKSTSTSSDTIKLNCPAVQPQHACPTTTTEASTTTTTEMTTTKEMTTRNEITTENINSSNETTTKSHEDSKHEGSSKSNTSHIIGSIIGVVVVVVVVVTAFIIYMIKRKKGANNEDVEGNTNSEKEKIMPQYSTTPHSIGHDHVESKIPISNQTKMSQESVRYRNSEEDDRNTCHQNDEKSDKNATEQYKSQTPTISNSVDHAVLENNTPHSSQSASAEHNEEREIRTNSVQSFGAIDTKESIIGVRTVRGYDENGNPPAYNSAPFQNNEKTVEYKPSTPNEQSKDEKKAHTFELEQKAENGEVDMKQNDNYDLYKVEGDTNNSIGIQDAKDRKKKKKAKKRKKKSSEELEKGAEIGKMDMTKSGDHGLNVADDKIDISRGLRYSNVNSASFQNNMGEEGIIEGNPTPLTSYEPLKEEKRRRKKKKHKREHVRNAEDNEGDMKQSMNDEVEGDFDNLTGTQCGDVHKKKRKKKKKKSKIYNKVEPDLDQ